MGLGVADTYLAAMADAPAPGRPIILPAGVTWHAVAAGIGAGILSTDPRVMLAPIWARPGRRLPSTLAEYRAQLYGPAGRDWWPACNAGALAAGLGLVASVAAALLT
jgi:hypothetical protein